MSQERPVSIYEPTRPRWKAKEDLISSSRWKSTKDGNSESTSYSVAARNGRTLQEIILAGIYTKDWGTEELYSGIRDIHWQQEGLASVRRGEFLLSSCLEVHHLLLQTSFH